MYSFNALLMHCATDCTMTPYMEQNCFYDSQQTVLSMKTNSMRSRNIKPSQSGSPQEPNTARINRMYTHTFIKNMQTHTLWRSDVHVSSSQRHRQANECQAMKIINNYSKRECSGLENRQDLQCCSCGPAKVKNLISADPRTSKTKRRVLKTWLNYPNNIIVSHQ